MAKGDIINIGGALFEDVTSTDEELEQYRAEAKVQDNFPIGSKVKTTCMFGECYEDEGKPVPPITAHLDAGGVATIVKRHDIGHGVINYDLVVPGILEYDTVAAMFLELA